jgi:GTP-binding protein EngB required for normal cell division
MLERVAALANEWQLAGLQPVMDACRRQLNGSHGIDVAVVGRFKAGKSSFVNDLAGREIVPVGVVPVTAVVTRLRAGESDAATIQFLNGTTKAIPLNEIHFYVGEAENPNNVRQVATVEAQLPELKPLAPLQFVDTPGLDSALSHNTEAAMNWLPNVGAALLAVSTDAPLSERDLALLEELRRHTPRIALLLTKADLLTENQRDEVLHFIRKQLRNRGTRREEAHNSETRSLQSKNSQSLLTSAATKSEELPVYFYSIHPALADLKSRLRDELLLPLLHHRDETSNQILKHKLASLINQTLDYLRVALASATHAESARSGLHDKLAEERRQFALFSAELNAFTRQCSSNALEWYLSELLPVQKELQGKIAAELREEFSRWHRRLPPLLEAWRGWLDAFLRCELFEVSHARQPMFREPLHKARTHLARTLTAFHDRLATHVKEALGVTLTGREFVLDVAEPEAPPVDVAFAFDAAFTNLGWLIPLTLFRRPIERNLLRKARWEVEKNLSRLASDWRDRVARGIAELTRQAEKNALDELTTLEQTLNQSSSKMPELKQAIDELEQFQQQLHE